MRSVCVLQNEGPPGGAQPCWRPLGNGLASSSSCSPCNTSLGGTWSFCALSEVKKLRRGCRCRPTLSPLWASDTNTQWCPSRPTVPGRPYREIPLEKRPWRPSQYPHLRAPRDGGLSPWIAQAAQLKRLSLPACLSLQRRGLAASWPHSSFHAPPPRVEGLATTGDPFSTLLPDTQQVPLEMPGVASTEGEDRGPLAPFCSLSVSTSPFHRNKKNAALKG